MKKHAWPRLSLWLSALILMGGRGFPAASGQQVATQAAPAPDRLSFIDNGQIKVGVNLDLGGSISWISAPEHPGNLVNNSDWGRQIQLSFYSGPHPFEPGGKKAHPAWKNWSWNPIQSGDVYRNRARVINLENSGREISLTSIPMQWALDNEPGDCRFEARIALEGPMARVRYRLVNARADQKFYPGAHQELPAIYTISALEHLMSYTGEAPFTAAPLTAIANDWKKPFPWTSFVATEGWVAAVNDQQWGLGVCNPGIYSYLGGSYGGKLSEVSTHGSTMYISPVTTDILDHNITYDFEVLLRVGKLPELREFFTARTAALELPSWQFASDRQHWHLRGGMDAGWPMSGAWKIRPITGQKTVLESPVHPWRSERAPRLRLKGNWKNLSGQLICVMDSQEKLKFPLNFPPSADGSPASLEIDLAAEPRYRGLARQLQILPDFSRQNGEFDLCSVELLGH